MLSIKDLIRRVSDGSATSSVDEVKARAIKRSARAKRQQMRRDWNVAALPPAARAGAERAIRARVKSQFKPQGKKQVRLAPKEQILLLRAIRPSKILDRLFPKRLRPGRWLKIADRDASRPDEEIDIKEFSLLSNPRATLTGLERIAEAEAIAPGAKINFRDAYCLDVVPFMLLAECWNEMIPIFEGGKMAIPMQKVLAAVGVQHALGIRLGGVEELSDVWAFPLIRRRGAGSTKSESPFLDVQSREVASDQFCDALDEWLSRPEIGICLSEQGTEKIKNILGELLENAERHSDGRRRDGSWAVSGFMARRLDEETNEWVYRAHLGIVGIGDTFSESLQRSRPQVCEALDGYVKEMHSKGARQSRETLRTLCAVQDGVTCAADADAEDRGGFGLQEMLDLVSILGETSKNDRRPRVTILSGASCIMLREPYIRGQPQSPQNSTRVLWCNATNSSHEPPDESFVFDLEPGLPGTAISVGFVLDPEFLRQATSQGDEHGNN